MEASELLLDEDVEDERDRNLEEESQKEAHAEEEYYESFEDEDSGGSSLVKSERQSTFALYEPWKEERAREALAREQERRERIRKLGGTELRKDDGESIKTVLSLQESEDLDKIDEEISSEASSNPCLKSIEISDSQLKLYDLHNKYPIPEDPGLVPAFWVIHPPAPSYKDDGIQKFIDLVEKMNLRPINSVKEMLRTDTLNLRYYGIDPRIVGPLCQALAKNTSVQILDLAENWLTVDACCHLKNMLETNEVITRLDLSGCQIGAEGAKKLQNGIANSPALTDIDLSRCNIDDDGLRHVASAISRSNILEIVNLTDNHFGDNSAEYFSKMFAQTESLKGLDLSWNYLQGSKCGEIFFKGLSENSTLEYLNMSGNGLGKNTAPFLSSWLTNSQNIRELNLSGNRFTPNEAKQIAKALLKNTSLEILRIGNNPLESSGALALVNALRPDKSPKSQMRMIDLENIWARKDILPTLEKIKRERSWLSVKLGGILSNYKLQGPDAKKIFLRRANFEAMSPKKKKLRKKFGHFVFTLGEEAVSREIFKESVKRFKMKLTDSLVDEITKAFETAKDQVDQLALKTTYLKEYPNTRPPSRKPGKKTKKTMKKKKDQIKKKPR